jgi:hypothetical protein
MARVLGSRSVHQAMNDRMRRMLGQQGETRVRRLMGRRYTGCARGTAG